MIRIIQQADKVFGEATRKIQVSIIIVNWHSTHYLKECLQSIYQRIKEVEFEVIVIDNASFDGSADLIRRMFPQVIFIQNDLNVGFANANNIAVRQSTGPTVLFLNPDTEIIDSAVAEMFHHLMRNSTVGAVGCRVLNPDLTKQRYYLQAFPTLLNQVLDSDLLRRAFPRWKLWGMRAFFDYRGEPLDVEVVSGSCVMAGRSAFERVGGFTNSYFMYGEDLDLSYKLLHAGYRVQYLGEGVVIHHGGKSSDLYPKRNFAEITMRESTARFIEITKGYAYAQVFRYLTACAALFHLCVVFFLACLGGMIFFRGWVFAATNKWVRILYWATGFKDWTG
jgi:GT2 family glycosyltransferase